MKYTVTYRCGHTGEVELFGKAADRERKLRRYAEDDCPACEQASRLSKLAADVADGWCDLTGSDKQRMWANDIRHGKVSELETMAEKQHCSEQFRPYIEALKSIDDASWWINNRSQPYYFFSRHAQSVIG